MRTNLPIFCLLILATSFGTIACGESPSSNRAQASPAPSPKSVGSREDQLFKTLEKIIATEAGEKEDPKNVLTAKNLIEAGANVNARGYANTTPLIEAAHKGHIQIMRILLDHGADVNAQGSRGTTALMSAAEVSDVAMVKLLLSKKPDVNIKADDGFTAYIGSEMVNGSTPANRQIRALLKAAGAKDLPR